ncbi:MAG: hypothetical protein WCI18_16685, partial [Pseudomonadota bacterium]
SSSIVGTIAFGPNAGQKVTRIGSGFGYYEEIPLAKGHRCFSINGFSLHANTSTNTWLETALENWSSISPAAHCLMNAWRSLSQAT